MENRVFGIEHRETPNDLAPVAGAGRWFPFDDTWVRSPELDDDTEPLDSRCLGMKLERSLFQNPRL